MKKEKRFRRNSLNHIEDGLTGKTYSSVIEFVKIMNDLDERANNIVEAFLKDSTDIDYWAERGLWNK